jgi:hypothetical protein
VNSETNQRDIIHTVHEMRARNVDNNHKFLHLSSDFASG